MNLSNLWITIAYNLVYLLTFIFALRAVYFTFTAKQDPIKTLTLPVLKRNADKVDAINKGRAIS